jgi:hypothetical protein
LVIGSIIGNRTRQPTGFSATALDGSGANTFLFGAFGSGQAIVDLAITVIVDTIARFGFGEDLSIACGP